MLWRQEEELREILVWSPALLNSSDLGLSGPPSISISSLSSSPGLSLCVFGHFFFSILINQNGLRRPNPHHHCAQRGSAPARILIPPPSVCCQENRLADLLFSIILGTDASQGKGQIISNINACVAVQSTIKSTLGPYGGDLLLVDSNARQTITNDGATVMKVRERFLSLGELDKPKLEC